MEVSWKVKNTLDLLNSCCVVSAVPGISCRVRDRAHGADGNPAAQRAHAPPQIHTASVGRQAESKPKPGPCSMREGKPLMLLGVVPILDSLTSSCTVLVDIDHFLHHRPH